MIDDEALERAVIDEYRQTSHAVERLRGEVDALGRTDVPLCDPLHINNADDATRAAWWAKYSGLQAARRAEGKAQQRLLIMLMRRPR